MEDQSLSLLEDKRSATLVNTPSDSSNPTDSAFQASTAKVTSDTHLTPVESRPMKTSSPTSKRWWKPTYAPSREEIKLQTTSNSTSKPWRAPEPSMKNNPFRNSCFHRFSRTLRRWIRLRLDSLVKLSIVTFSRWSWVMLRTWGIIGRVMLSIRVDIGIHRSRVGWNWMILMNV